MNGSISQTHFSRNVSQTRMRRGQQGEQPVGSDGWQFLFEEVHETITIQLDAKVFVLVSGVIIPTP